MNPHITRTIVALAKTPFWLFELFTTAKSYKGNLIIGSPVLNRLGLHVVRLVISHGIMRARMWILAIPTSRRDRQFYFREGYLFKENFLSNDGFSALEKEARAFNGDIREARQGDTITLRAALSPDVLETMPAIDSLINSRQLKQFSLEALGLSSANVFAVKKNTLVFANTFGIHRRGDSAQKSTRLALWGDSCTNPFNPLPGLGGKAINSIQYYFLALYRKKADEKATKKGGRSPWKLLENNGTSIEDR